MGGLDNALGGTTGAFGSAAGAASRLVAALPLGPIAAIGTAVAVASGSVASAAVQLANYAKEISNLASLSSLSIEDFSSVAYAFQSVGISSEQTADILKDVNDRIGEFNLTGSGGFADALDAVGISADQATEKFKGLSGPDVLVELKKQMDAVNLSSEEQTYVMESLANDSTKLIPLLESEGKALKGLAREHDSVNRVLNEDTLEATKKYNDAVNGLMLRLSNFGNEVLIPIISILGDAAEGFNDLWDAVTGDGDPVEKLDEQINGLNVRIKNQTRQLESLGFAQELQRKALRKQILELEEQKKALEGEKEALEGATIAKKDYAEISITNSAGDGSSSEVDVQQDVHDQLVELEKEFNEKNKELKKQLNEALNELDQERADTQKEIITESNEETLSSWEQLLKDMKEETGQYDEMVLNMTDRFTSGFGDAIASAIVDSENLGDAFEDMSKGIIKSIIAMAGEWVAQKLVIMSVESLMGATAGAAAGASMTAEALAAQQMAALHAFSSTAAIPVVGPGLAPGAALAAEIATAPFVASITGAAATMAGAGAAHGGLTNVPNEQTYLLQRGERVLSPKQNQDFTQFIQSGGGAGGGITINVSGGDNTSPEALARAVERTLRRRTKRTDREIARASARGQKAGA
ncbi:hypothetical protein JCM19232_2645 [Vibrio ishigakensis]|uniref:Phage tail length tape-measure protein n=1 Tax=Vibrio ishigakensis TaxID=1481914 RepID=A0A0B8PA28_9VIBR|nr:hypothetical protein JCM19232_2645 [Vibrio ishigakensis]